MSNYARAEGIPAYTGPNDPADAAPAADPGQPGTPAQPAAPASPDSLAVPVQADPARPAWLPAKFKTAEDMAKGYESLERTLSQANAKPAAPAKPAKGDAPAPDSGPLGDEAFEAFDREYQANGKLSEESYSKLEKAGYRRNFVDGYIRGQEARAGELMGQVWEATGGQEAYAQVVQWASKNVPETDLRHFNAMVNSGDPDQTLFAIRSMMARYSSAGNAVQRMPTRRVEGGNGGGGPAKFRSQHEITMAMSNPRYNYDEAYRADVAARMP
jgi:hypothetical protein